MRLDSAVWALASAVGPPIGGALGSSGNWRWLFYLNLPISATAMALVLIFFRLKTPKTSLKEKMEQMDYANLVSQENRCAGLTGLAV